MLAHTPPAIRTTSPSDHPTPGRHFIARFDHYEFDPDGTPHRVRAPLTGPRPLMGEQKPLAGRDAFALRTSGGGRAVVSRSSLSRMIHGAGQPAEFFEMPEFPSCYFDSNGRCYRRRGRGHEYRFKETSDEYGFPLRTYRLINRDGRSVTITDALIRRVAAGKGTFRSAPVPEGCRPIGSEFPDYCCDRTGQPYRTGCRVRPVHRALRVAPDGLRGRFNLYDYAGRRRWVTLDECRDMAGFPNPEPLP